MRLRTARVLDQQVEKTITQVTGHKKDVLEKNETNRSQIKTTNVVSWILLYVRSMNIRDTHSSVVDRIPSRYFMTGRSVVWSIRRQEDRSVYNLRITQYRLDLSLEYHYTTSLNRNNVTSKFWTLRLFMYLSLKVRQQNYTDKIKPVQFYPLSFIECKIQFYKEFYIVKNKRSLPIESRDRVRTRTGLM